MFPKAASTVSLLPSAWKWTHCFFEGHWHLTFPLKRITFLQTHWSYNHNTNTWPSFLSQCYTTIFTAICRSTSMAERNHHSEFPLHGQAVLDTYTNPHHQLVLGTEPRVLCRLGVWSTTKCLMPFLPTQIGSISSTWRLVRSCLLIRNSRI